MGRKPRLHVSGGLYHLITRGNNRQIVFEEREHRVVFLYFLDEYALAKDVTVYAYVLMTNHVHLLVEVGEEPISEFMRCHLARYTRWFNRRHGRVGHLFQGRYKAFLCEKDAYLKELVRYIHLNPVRAGLVKEPEEFEWSSHRAYTGEALAGCAAVEAVLGLFGPSWERARASYRQFMEDGKSRGHRTELYQAVEGRYLGSPEFLTAIRAKEKRISQRPTRLDRPRRALDEMAAEVAAEFRITVAALRSAVRSTPLPEARARFCHRAVIGNGHRPSELASWLRCDRSSVTRSIQRVKLRNTQH